MTSATAPRITVRVTAVLQKLTGGQKHVEAQGQTVAEVLEDLENRHPGFKAQMLGDDGKLHRFVNVYLNDEDIRYTGGVDTAIKEGDVIDILPALAGGAR
ncbi:MAG: ubiquitin-like small modifier protein 1 [Dehalococcoidia bacterium]|nr:ubiquitin-like small modifier protein 1 [Dehalococcoidia bacterium]